MSDRSRSPSPAARSRTASPAPSGSWPAPMGRDPAKPPPSRELPNTRMELPSDAYLMDTQKSPFALRGNRLNTVGAPIRVEVNQYRVRKFDFSRKIYQFDVSISPQPKKLAPVLKKILAHPKFRAQFPRGEFEKWIFDGKALAWAPSKPPRDELRVQCDLDEGQPQSKSKSTNNFFLIIRFTVEINVGALQGYLEGKISMNTAVLEAMNFIDHLLRAWPSKNLLAIKRNFYNLSAPPRPLLDGAVVEVRKGLYWSGRLCATPGLGLGINADVANTCFFVGDQDFVRLTCNFLACQERRFNGLDGQRLTDALRPIELKPGQWAPSDAFKQLRRLRRLRFKVRHAGRPSNLSDKVISVEDFSWNFGNGAEGSHANNTFFDKDGRNYSVAQYFQQMYNVRLRYPRLPLIQAGGKKGWFPMELCFLEPNQRYPYKLTPDQTSAMIKIAVTRPRERRADIERNVQALRITEDPYLKQYGVDIEPRFATADARLLPDVTVNFKTGAAKPGHSGRWDLRGKKFWRPNVAPLSSWGFLVMDSCVQLPSLTAFAKSFRQTFINHGGNSPQDAKLMNPPGQISRNAAEAVAWAVDQLKRERGYPQLLFIVVQQKNSPHYERIKKNCDYRFGVLSQVVNSMAIQNNNGQYHSNVCMKVNGKLGGATSRTLPPWKSQTYFPADRPTMIIGLDISHGPPGSGGASTAAMTLSVTPDANKYASICETNGRRVEILTPTNVHGLISRLIPYWKENHPGKFPSHIILLRDGVSEGEFAQVLDKEVAQLKAWFAQNGPPKAATPKFTCLVATKRHHLRLWPQRGDKNGNALPGTVVEKEITHPHHLQFVLSSHVAIQGTARPTVYTVLLDEMNMPINDLQRMLYEQCYSYARSTTPVSIHPAIYYAHLAAARSRAHENIATSEGARSGAKGHELSQMAQATGTTLPGMSSSETDVQPLLPLGGRASGDADQAEIRQRTFFRGTMWFI